MAARAMSKNGGWLEVLFVALMSIGLSWAFSLSHVPRRELTSPLLKHTKATALGKARDARHFAFPAAALFGFGGGEKSSRGARSGSGVSGKARKAIESNAVFKSRTEQVCHRHTRTAVSYYEHVVEIKLKHLSKCS